MRTRLLSVITLAMIFVCVGCGSKPDQPTVERIRSEAAVILKKEPTQIDVAKPLIEQGADELDIVVIVLAVEEALDVKIPDSVIGEDVEEIAKTLTVENLAEIVSKQKEK